MKLYTLTPCDNYIISLGGIGKGGKSILYHQKSLQKIIDAFHYLGKLNE